MGNFILGIITGIVLLLILIFAVGECGEKSIGEDIVYVRMKKSEMEEFNKIYKEVNKTIDVRAKDGSFQSTYVEE